MKSLLKATIAMLPVILAIACTKQEAATDAAPAQNEVAETQALADADQGSEQEFSEGELAAPADEADLAGTPSVTQAEYEAATASAVPEPATTPMPGASVAPVAAASTAAVPSPAPKVATAPPRPPVDEAKVLGEKHGQWASTAKASSTYASDTGPKAPYSAWQATGAPNVPAYADDAASWASRTGDATVADWLELGFAKPVRATSIRVRQNSAPGAISKIELIDESGGTHLVWEGTDTTVYEKNTIGWFAADFPQTAYKVKGARVTVATSRVWGYNEIDAVQLVGEK